MTVTSVTGTTSTAATSGTGVAAKGGLSALGQGDFLKLMTVQMQQQDPFNPVDQKEMLAQMAQFSSLAGISEVNDTLKAIATKLDTVMASQTAAQAIAAGTAQASQTSQPISQTA